MTKIIFGNLQTVIKACLDLSEINKIPDMCKPSTLYIKGKPLF